MERSTILSKPTFAQTWANKITIHLIRMRWIVILILFLSLCGCASLQDPETSQENRGDVIAVLQPGQTFGQTFVSRNPDLQQMLIWLNVDKGSLTNSGRFVVELYHQPGEAMPISSMSYDLQALVNEGSLNITLKTDSKVLPAGAYYLEFRTEGGSVQFLGRNEDAYAQGEAFLNRQPLDADLSFRSSYHYGPQAVWQDFRRWLGQIWLILPLCAVLWLPGRLILRLAGFDRRLDWGERSAVAIGLSLAVLPILMLWTTMMGLHWSRPAVVGMSVVLFSAYIYYLHPTTWHINRIKISWTSLALAAVFLFCLAARLAMVRDLAGPAWVDSVHHALLARLIMEQGGLPSTYAPYLQVTTTSYHSGYHTVLAAFAWLSGLDLAQAMLVLGQVLNAFAVLVVYLLTTTFTHRPVAGIFAALVAGVITPMPAYYTSWGRYTQLTGLLVLPVAFYFLKYILDQPSSYIPHLRMEKESIKTILIASLLLAGLVLVHYRVLAFLGALILAYWGVYFTLAIAKRRPWRESIGGVLGLAMVGFLSLLITLPWWPATITSFVLPMTADRSITKAFSDFSWSYLIAALGKYAIGLAGIGLFWSIVQRRAFGIVMLLWVIFMFAIANISVLGLPGGNFINNTSVAITLFMPMALLSGYPLGWAADGWAVLIPVRWKPAYWAFIALTGAILAVVGARFLIPILNPGTNLIRQADLPAMEWVNKNIPKGATLLINPFLWGYGVYAGNDGGYWISPLAGRNTLPPAALYNYDFTRINARRITANSQKVMDLAADPEALHTFLVQQGIQYVYSGVRGGALSPKALKASPLFGLLYENQGAFVFEVK
jgi:hypothetical protein